MFVNLNNKLTPTLINYAEVEMKRFSGLIINKAISNYALNNDNIDDLFIITKDNDGVIKTIDFNPIMVNKLLAKITEDIQINLKNIINGNVDSLTDTTNLLSSYDESKLKKGIIFEIPSGIVFKNALLSNLGPRIPVRLNLIGDVVSNINTKITNYGINNAMMEVNVNIELNEQVILPFVTKQITHTTQVPISIKLIQGIVPNYYFNGIDKNSPNLAIPME